MWIVLSLAYPVSSSQSLDVHVRCIVYVYAEPTTYAGACLGLRTDHDLDDTRKEGHA